MTRHKLVSLKRPFAVLLAVIMIVGLLPTMALAAGFSDTSEHWAKDAIEKWTEEYKLLSGYEDGTFKPNDPMKRGEFAMLMDLIMKYQAKAANTFTDVPAGEWYEDAVLKLFAAKAISGVGDNQFAPDAFIKRQEAFMLLQQVFGVPTDTSSLSAFSDSGDIADWAKAAVGGMVKAGYVQGADGKLNPLDNITRGGVVLLLDNIIKAIYGTAGTYTADAKGIVVVNAPGVVLKDMEIKGDLYVAPGVGDGDCTLDNVKVLGTMHVLGGGENSVIIKGGSSVGAVRVFKDPTTGAVRVVAEDGSEVEVVYVDDGSDDVIITGEFGDIELGEGVTVNAVDAAIKNADVGAGSSLVLSGQTTVENAGINGDGGKLTVGAGTEVGKVTVNANGADISGSGTITGGVTVESGEGNKVTVPNTEIKVSDGAGAVTTPDGEIKPGETGGTGEGGGEEGSESFTVTYDGNGADTGTAPVDANVYYSGSTVTVKNNSNLSITNKTGFSFDGWNTEADGSGTAYAGTDTFIIRSNVTLYAQWAYALEDGNEYTAEYKDAATFTLTNTDGVDGKTIDITTGTMYTTVKAAYDAVTSLANLEFKYVVSTPNVTNIVGDITLKGTLGDVTVTSPATITVGAFIIGTIKGDAPTTLDLSGAVMGQTEVGTYTATATTDTLTLVAPTGVSASEMPNDDTATTGGINANVALDWSAGTKNLWTWTPNAGGDTADVKISAGANPYIDSIAANTTTSVKITLGNYGSYTNFVIASSTPSTAGSVAESIEDDDEIDLDAAALLALASGDKLYIAADADATDVLEFDCFVDAPSTSGLYFLNDSADNLKGLEANADYLYTILDSAAIIVTGDASTAMGTDLVSPSGDMSLIRINIVTMKISLPVNIGEILDPTVDLTDDDDPLDDLSSLGTSTKIAFGTTLPASITGDVSSTLGQIMAATTSGNVFYTTDEVEIPTAIAITVGGAETGLAAGVWSDGTNDPMLIAKASGDITTANVIVQKGSTYITGTLANHAIALTGYTTGDVKVSIVSSATTVNQTPAVAAAVYKVNFTSTAGNTSGSASISGTAAVSSNGTNYYKDSVTLSVSANDATVVAYTYGDGTSASTETNPATSSVTITFNTAKAVAGVIEINATFRKAVVPDGAAIGTDTNMEYNKITADVTINEPATADGFDLILGYKAYWGQDSSTKSAISGAPIGTAAKTTQDAAGKVVVSLDGAEIPADATHILVFAYNINEDESECDDIDLTGADKYNISGTFTIPSGAADEAGEISISTDITVYVDGVNDIVHKSGGDGVHAEAENFAEVAAMLTGGANELDPGDSFVVDATSGNVTSVTIADGNTDSDLSGLELTVYLGVSSDVDFEGLTIADDGTGDTEVDLAINSIDVQGGNEVTISGQLAASVAFAITQTGGVVKFGALTCNDQDSYNATLTIAGTITVADSSGNFYDSAGAQYTSSSTTTLQPDTYTWNTNADNGGTDGWKGALTNQGA